MSKKQKSHYQRDELQFEYGKSKRVAEEMLFVKHINFMKKEHPSYEIVLMGTTGVNGEKFPLYLTECYFKLPNKESIDSCLKALKESDELIRRRSDGPGAGWSWNSAWLDRLEMRFYVNWYDTAYFLKYRQIFQGKDHSRYAMDFGLDISDIQHKHFRIDEKGGKNIFNEKKLNSKEAELNKLLPEINFHKEYKKKRY